MLAEKFCHALLGFEPFRDRKPMVTVRRDDIVVRSDGGYRACRYGFLSVVQMTESSDLAHAVKLCGLLLETTDEQHVVVPGQERVFWES